MAVITAAELSNTFASIVEATGRSVVRVEGRRRAASGLAWSPTQVITVFHAVHREEQVVVGVEGAEFKATVKGVDPSTDLALLEVAGGALTPASFDDGAQLKVGHLVLRLGRPGETVRATAGIVQAQGNKPWRAPRGGEIDRYLEADAAHEPGFSGGPLVGLDGRVVGLTSNGLLRGRSLTVPTLTLRRVVIALQTHGKVRQSYLGLSMQPVRLPPEVQQATSDELGMLVVAVEKGGPAEQAGLVYGDTVLHLGDDSVKTVEDLYSYLRADHVGQTVPVKLWRGGKPETVQVTLGVRP